MTGDRTGHHPADPADLTAGMAIATVRDMAPGMAATGQAAIKIAAPAFAAGVLDVLRLARRRGLSHVDCAATDQGTTRRAGG
jgi:transketolase C-terminal domain/subunit